MESLLALGDDVFVILVNCVHFTHLKDSYGSKTKEYISEVFNRNETKVLKKKGRRKGKRKNTAHHL